MPDPASCPAYFQCVSRCVEHSECPGGEVFSDMYMECQPLGQVECGARPCLEEEHCGGDKGDCTPPDQWIDCSQTGDYSHTN